MKCVAFKKVVFLYKLVLQVPHCCMIGLGLIYKQLIGVPSVDKNINKNVLTALLNSHVRIVLE